MELLTALFAAMIALALCIGGAIVVGLVVIALGEAFSRKG